MFQDLDPSIVSGSAYALLIVVAYIVGVWFFCKWRYGDKNRKKTKIS